jgi:DNA-binding GntR family transcriptional regulator
MRKTKKPAMGATAQLLTDELRRAILRGQYRAGEVLRQEQIAAAFGVSRIPLREALLNLEAQRLVEIHPNRGAYVCALSRAEADEIYEMRLALEPLALRRALPHLGEREFLHAAGLLNDIDHATDPARWADLNWAFHGTLYQACSLPRLMSTLEQLHATETRYFVVLDTIVRFRAQSQKDHRELLRICRSGNATRACACLIRQLNASRKKLLGGLSIA